MILAAALTLHCLRALIDWAHPDPWGSLVATIESYPDWRDGSPRWSLIGYEVGIQPAVDPYPPIHFASWTPRPLRVETDYRGRAMAIWSKEDGSDLVGRQEFPERCLARTFLVIGGWRDG